MLQNTNLIICNKALKMVKQSTITSLNENTKEAEIVNLHYTFVKRLVLSSYAWSNTIFKATLEPNYTLKQNNYNFAYNLPLDLIKIVKHNGGPYIISNNTLYSNYNSCCIEYVKDIAENDMPLYLINYLSIRLALEISYSFLDDISFINYLKILSDTEFKMATNVDSQSNTTTNNSTGNNFINNSWVFNK